MTLRPRKDWTTAKAADANPFNPDYIRGVAVHWNGPPVPQSALTDPRSYLEGVRRYHTATKGWSDIAYNLAVDQNGDVWVLRGLKHMSGANGDTEANSKYVAVLGIVGQGQKPTDRMYAGIRDAILLVRAQYPNAVQVRTHNQVRPSATACPGPQLTLAVTTGLLEPSVLPVVSVAKMRDAWEKDRHRKTGLHPAMTRRVQKALGFQVRTGRWGRPTRARFGANGPTEATLRALGKGKYRTVE